MDNRRQIGTRYETEAARYLENQGLQVLEQNFRCRQGEIDLIARDGEYLVFVEVKYRKDGHMGTPFEAVGPVKQQRLRKTAEYYLYTHRTDTGVPCRFDVVGIAGDQISWIPNAF